MYKKCKQCEKLFKQERKDKVFCSKRCLWKYNNDKKPRKTKKSYFKSSSLKNKHIPQNQLDVIYGTLMGDSCLILQTDGFHRMSLCHCEKQKDYLLWKKNILSSIFIQENINEYNHNNNIQYHSGSISHSDLTNIYGTYYRGNKKKRKKYITRKTLNLLNETSILFWYLDDGSFIKSNKSIVLCTDNFSLSEVKAIKIWLWQRFKIETKILQVKGSYGKNVYYRIRMNCKPTKQFLDLISHSPFYKDIPKCMKYKIELNSHRLIR